MLSSKVESFDPDTYEPISHIRLETHPKGILLAVAVGLVGFIGALCFLFAVVAVILVST